MDVMYYHSVIVLIRMSHYGKLSFVTNKIISVGMLITILRTSSYLERNKLVLLIAIGVRSGA